MENENKKIKFISAIGLFLSVFFFLIAIYMNVNNGYARDAGYFVPRFFGNGIWVLLFGSIIGAIYFLITLLFKNNTIPVVSTGIIFIVLLIYGLTVTVGWFHSYNEVKNGIRSPNVTPVTLEKLDKIIDSGNESIIYVGRQSCPVCEYIMPYFIHYIETININIFYYDTSLDRNSRPEKMNEILDSISVKYIPMTLCIDKGTIVKVFSGENMVTNMKEYFESEEGTLFLEKINSK